MDISTIYLIINVAVYLAFLIYISKNVFRGFSATSFVVGWYLFSAVSSVLFYTHPLTPSTPYFNPIEWQGLIYFTGLTFCLLWPIYKFEKDSYTLEHAIDDSTMVKVMKILLVLQVIVMIFYMSDFLRLVDTDFGDVRDAATQGDESTLTKKNPLIAWCLTFNLALRNIITIIAFYAMVYVQSNRKFVTFFFVFSVAMPFFLSVLFVMRSYMVFQILLVFFLFILFHDKFSATFKKRVYIAGGAFLFLVITFMGSVSDNRFGDMVTWFYYKYAGETFVNFGGQMWPDLKDCTGGTVYFQWIGKLFGVDFDKMSLSDKWQYMNGITGIDTHIFYGFIGGLVMEFHFLPTAIIVIILSLIFKKFISHGTLRLSNLLLIGELANILFTGSFLFAYQGLWGNFEIIFVIFGYLYIRKLENRQNSIIV